MVIGVRPSPCVTSEEPALPPVTVPRWRSIPNYPSHTRRKRRARPNRFLSCGCGFAGPQPPPAAMAMVLGHAVRPVADPLCALEWTPESREIQQVDSHMGIQRVHQMTFNGCCCNAGMVTVRRCGTAALPITVPVVSTDTRHTLLQRRRGRRDDARALHSPQDRSLA